MSYTTVTVHVTALLNHLGGTSEHVHDRLLALDCKGRRDDCGACPIAVYLLRSDLNPSQVFVGDSTVTLIFGDPAEPDQRVDVRVPEPVSEFVHRYDSGVYLDLVQVPAVTR